MKKMFLLAVCALCLVANVAAAGQCVTKGMENHRASVTQAMTVEQLGPLATNFLLWKMPVHPVFATDAALLLKYEEGVEIVFFWRGCRVMVLTEE